MDIDGWTDACSKCKQIEQIGNAKSHRSTGNYFVDNYQEGPDDSRLLYLDIDYSNACNAACGMCYAGASSSIAKIMRTERFNHVAEPRVRRDKFYDFLAYADLSNLRSVKFRGGEPFYSNFHKDVLKKIAIPKRCNIVYQTNGSIYPDAEWWEIVKNFNNVYMSFSIDAIGHRFNFLRNRLDFVQVDKNINMMLNYPTVSGGIEVTFSPLNLYYFDEIYDYYLSLRKIHKKLDFNWHACNHDWDLNNCTPDLKQAIRRRYHKNNKVLSIVENLQFDDNNFTTFIHSVRQHESRSGMQGIEIFPEIWDLATKYPVDR
jgi:MoaA/NifB/PqqE/SkfB family radical SAM enzyme